MKIAAIDISVVVQGPICGQDVTQKCLNSIRAQLPNATIILSTWKGENVQDLSYDILVETEDPGNVTFEGLAPNNVNRQIVSTLNGLKKITTPYALKIRSDMTLESTLFLEYFDRFPKRIEQFRVFEKRILNGPCGIKRPNKINKLLYTNTYTKLFSAESYKRISYISKLLFHPADWIFFGLTEDLLKLWDIPLATSTYFYYFDPKTTDAELRPNRTTVQYSAEQYIFTSCLKKYGPLDYRDASQYTEKNEIKSIQALFNNFIFLDEYLWGYRTLKHNPGWLSWQSGLISYDFYRWQKDYKTFCDPSYKVSYTRAQFLSTISYIPYRIICGIKKLFAR